MLELVTHQSVSLPHLYVDVNVRWEGDENRNSPRAHLPSGHTDDALNSGKSVFRIISDGGL